MTIRVHFKHSEKLVEVYPGKTLLSIARENKIRIISPCGGNGLCGGCKVRVINGNDKMDVSAEEYDKLTDREIEDNIRLACSFIVSNNITVGI